MSILDTYEQARKPFFHLLVNEGLPLVPKEARELLIVYAIGCDENLIKDQCKYLAENQQ